MGKKISPTFEFVKFNVFFIKSALILCLLSFIMNTLYSAATKILRLIHFQNYCQLKKVRSPRLRSKTDMELKHREDPIVTKLDTPEFKNLFTKEVQDLQKLFEKYNYEIRIAGGAVRDLLMGIQPKDLDFATTATPEELKEMFSKENIRMINMSGEKHGTITPRINEKENFEITTLRVDIITDGRHAEVEFTKDWKLDANRRDLTINSMFLGFDGSVYDYFYGYDDLMKRKVAFVGDADIRIKEDYLRIMRYFRFYGRIAENPNNHDVQPLEVIKNNAQGLENISGERIWMELKKTLQGNFAGDLLKTMLSVNIGKYMGLPDPNVEELDKVLKRSQYLGLHPISYLAALLNDIDAVTVLHSRLKFSGYERDMAYFLVEHREDKEAKRPLLPYEKLVLQSKMKQKDVVEYTREILKYRGDEALLKHFDNWEIPRFPIDGKILKKNGVPPGKMYGPIIGKLKDIWIESEYKLLSEDLVKFIPNIVEEFTHQNKTA